jgi:HK97 gp10 family phage protein
VADWWKDDADIERRMREAADGVGFSAEAVVRSATLETLAIAVATAPVRTGHLKASHSVDFDGSAAGHRFSGTVGPEASYAHYVHDGTSRQAPQPWLDRAADIVEPQFYAGMQAVAASIDGSVSRRRG